MKTLNPIRAWISICSIIVLSSATKHTSSHHNGTSHHGDSSSLKGHHSTIVPHTIQIPEQVLSAKEIACISADSNIFEIMEKAQETCKGNDLRCTFYHFVNQDYNKIGTTDVDKELFDDLLKKFDNWLLTAEHIDKDDKADGNVDEESGDIVSENRNDGSNNNAHFSEKESLHTNHRKHGDHTNVTDNNKVHTHHIKKPHEPHHNNHSNVHGDNGKNSDYIIKNAEYNKDHRYFEVFLPKDKESGKSKTIYVEIDKDKNECVLLDENINEDLQNDKSVKIELDELSEIADTVFNDVVKTSNHTEHNDNDLTDDEKAVVNDISNRPVVHDDSTNLHVDVEETDQSNISSTILIPKIPDDTTVNANESGRKNLVEPNHQAPFNVELQLVNQTDDHLELLESIDNEEITPHADLECNNNTDLDLDDIEFSCHENEHENVIIDDASITNLVENNDLENNFSPSDKAAFQNAKPFQKNKLPSTLDPTSRISDYIGSQMDPMQAILRGLSPVPNIPLSTYSTVPILGKDLAKVLETDSNLHESFPAYAILDTPSNSDFEHPLIASYTSAGDLSTAPNVCEFKFPLPAPPVECMVRYKGSENSPLNVGFSWLPSYSRIEELRLPSSRNSPPDCIPSLPIRSGEFPDSPESTDRTVPIEYQSVPSLTDDQETSESSEPFHFNAGTVIVPEHTLLPSQLPNTFNRIAATSTLRENPLLVPPCSSKSAIIPSGPIQQIPQTSSCFPTKNNILDNKQTIIPYSPYKNSPYPTFPYTANPYLKPPYLGPLLPVTPIRPNSNSLPISLDQTCSCTNGDYPQETRPMSLPPYTPFSPLNPMLLGPSFYPNTLSPYLWNSIPYYTLPSSPYTIIPDQDIRNFSPAGNLIESKILRPSPSKPGSLSHFEQPCSTKNILELSPSRYIPYPPVHKPPVQIESNSLQALERDLQFLSIKYGIPLTKILKNLGTDSDDKSCQRPLIKPGFKELNRHFHTNNGVVYEENRTVDEEFVSESDLSAMIPLDTSLIGPHLNIKSPSLILESNAAQINTVSSQTTVPLTSHTTFEGQDTTLDSSLIGPHLSTLSNTNSFLSEGNEVVQSESDSFLKPLTGPHLELGSPPVIVDLNKLQSKTLTVHPKVTLTQVKPAHVSQLSEIKPLFTSEIQNINEMVLDSENDKKPTKSLYPAVKLYEPGDYLLSNLVGSEIDSSSLIPLDSSLIGPHLNTGNSPITMNAEEYKTGTKDEELESIILPPSLLSKLLNTQSKANLNSNSHTQDTELNIKDISIKETDNKIIESIPNLSSVGSKVSHLSSKDSESVQHKIMSSEMSDLDYITELDSSLTGPGLHDIIQTPKLSTTILDSSSQVPSLTELHSTSTILDAAEYESSTEAPDFHKSFSVSDSKIRLDSSLIGPSLHHGIESLDKLESHFVDAENYLDSSLIGPSLSNIALLSENKVKILNHERLIPLDSSLIGPSLNFESSVEQSESSRNTNTDLLSASTKEVFETRDFVTSHSEDESSSTCICNQEELQSKLTNPMSVYKSQPSLSKTNLSKLLSSEQLYSYPSSSFNVCNPDFQTLTSNTPLSLEDHLLVSKFGQIQEQNLSPIESAGNGHTCTESNYILTPKSLAESVSYARGFPHTPIPLSPPFSRIKPLLHRWQVPQHLNYRNILQTPSGPVINTAPCNPNAFLPLSSNAEGIVYPGLYTPEINTPISPIELASLANVLPLNKYISSIPKNPSVIASNTESSVCNSGHNPIINDDIMSLIDEETFKLLKDMSILPLSQSSSTSSVPGFEKGTPPILPPPPLLNADYTKTGPVLPVPKTNPVVPSPIYNPPHNIPYMTQTSNMPSNLQPYPNELLGPTFPEILGPPPELVSQPTDCREACLESQLQDIPQLINSITDPIFDNELLQQPLSEPYLEPLTVLPSSFLDTKPQVPCPPPVFFIPISCINKTPLSNSFNSPILPISASATRLPSNVPYLPRPFIPSSLPIHPTGPDIPEFTSPFIPAKTTPSDYPYPPKTSIQPAFPYKLFAKYSSYSPVPSKPLFVEINPYSSKIMSEYSPENGQPTSRPIYRTVPKSLGSPEYSSLSSQPYTRPLLSTPTDLLLPYGNTIPSPGLTNTRPSNLSPAYLNSVSSLTSSPFKRPLSPNPNLQLTMQELQLLKRLNALSNSDAGIQFLKSYQKPTPNRIPFQSYSQTKEDIPCADAIEPNLEPIPLTEESPCFEDPEEMVCSYSNDRDDKRYEEPYFKCPLETLSYTLAPEEINEVLPEEDLSEHEDLLPCAPEICLGMEPVLQSGPYQSPDLKPYTPQYGDSLRPYPVAQSLPPPSLIDPIQDVYDNLPLLPPFMPLKVPPSILDKPIKQYPEAQFLPPPPLIEPVQENFKNLPLAPSSKPLNIPPAIVPSILYTPFLKPLALSSPALNPSSSPPLLPNPCTDISISPLLSSPYYSAPRKDIPSLSMDSKRLRNVISPQVSPEILQVPSGTCSMAMPSQITKPVIQLPTVPYTPDNYILMPPIYSEPKSKTYPCQGSLRPPLTPLNHQYVTPIEVPITVSSLKKIKPEISPKYMSSIAPTEYSPLKKEPTQYHPYIPPSPALTCPTKNIFKSAPVTTPYTVLPSSNNIVLPSKSSQWSSSTPQYSLPAATVPLPNAAYSEPTAHIAKQPMTNHIIPSSLFFIPDRSHTPTNNLAPSCNIPRFSLPSLALTELPATALDFTPSRPLKMTVPVQAILDPKSQSSNCQYSIQPLPDFYPVQPVPNVPFTTQLSPPIYSQYTAPCSTISYASSPLQKLPCQQTNMPIVETLPQKSCQFQPDINSHAQLLPPTNKILGSPLLKPLVSTSYNNVPLLPMPRSAFKPFTPSSTSINDKYISLPESHGTVVPDNLESVSPLSQYTLLKPLINKYQSPVSSLTPSYSNYNILETSPRLAMKANMVKPIDISAISPSESLRLSPEYLEAKALEKTVPYEIMPNLMDMYSPSPLRYNQLRPYLPTLKPRYSSKLQPSHTSSPLQNKFPSTSPYATEIVPLFKSPSSSSSDEFELTDDSNQIPIQSKPLIPSYSPTVTTPFYTNLSSRTPSYTPLVHTDYSSPIYKQHTPHPQSPVHMTPPEYEDSPQNPLISYTSSSPTVSTSFSTEPQLTRPLLDRMTLFQSPSFTKSMPLEKPIEVTPESESLPILLNNYEPFNKMTPLELYNYLNKPELSTSEVPLNLDPVNQSTPVNPLFKLEPYTEYTEDTNSNDYDPDSTNINKPDISETKPFTKSLPEFKHFNIPYNHKIVQRPQRLTNLDHFYENNHIGARPQVYTAPTNKPIGSHVDVTSTSTAFPDVGKHFTDLPTKHFEPVPNLDATCLRPNEFYPEIVDSANESPTMTISSPRNYQQPYLEAKPQLKYSPNTMEVPETSPSLYPYSNIKDMKYSGYKTYQIPSYKSPQKVKNLGLPSQIYPSIITQSSVPAVPPSKIHQSPGIPFSGNPTEFLEPQIPENQSPILRAAHPQTKSDLNPSLEVPQLNEDNFTEIPISTDNINEDNELKTSLINYINKKESLKDNQNEELTLPLGNIAIMKKEPSNANTIETNNPSIGLKVWKSNLKIAQAELKLKFKDLTVNNFMPIVNNLNKYDIEEIRKVVKNYIDEKYGNHIEVNEPYTADDKYTIIEDFDHNASDNKYNLLWPTNYV